MRKMSNNMRIEVEDIGRGNITAQQQLPAPLTSIPPPVYYTQTGGPPPHSQSQLNPPYGAPSQALPMDGNTGITGDGTTKSIAKICKKLVHGTCEFGLSGQSNGKCPNPHPQPCLGWKKNGER